MERQARRLSRTLAGVLLALLGCVSLEGSSKTANIDRFCKQLMASLSDTTPFILAGPDPWVELESLPSTMPSDSIAYVYAVGPQIRWVFVRLISREQGWSEDVSYFYRDDGSLMKRVRVVQSVAANTLLEIAAYYDGGHPIKRRSQHHSLQGGRQDLNAFEDPDAPEFLTTDDLPFTSIVDLWRGLA